MRTITRNILLACALGTCVSLAPAQPDAPAAARQIVMPTYGLWHSSRIGGGGYVQNVIPTSDPKRFYAIVDVGGLYRSDDGARTWTMLHGALPPVRGNYAVRGLVVDPRDSSKLVIATGDRWSMTDGIYLSDDAGKTWRPSNTQLYYDGNGGPRSAGDLILRDPTHPDRIYTASLNTGFCRSDDNGQTWTKLGLEQLNPTDLEIDQSNPKRMWVCAAPGDYRRGGGSTQEPGFFRTVDGGVTWEKLSDTPPLEVVQDPTNPDRLYGLRSSGCIVSQDAGATWTDFNDGLNYDPKKLSSVSDHAYRALTATRDAILIGSCAGSLFKLAPGDTTWKKIERESITDNGLPRGKKAFGWAMASIIVNPHDPKHWFITDFFGISQTHDAGKNWEITVDGIECTVIHTVVQDPTDPGVVHLGMADNGYFRSDNAGEHFARYPFPRDAITAKEVDVSPKLPARLYAIGSKLYDQQIAQVYVSIDRGDTWERSPMIGLPPLTKDMCTSIAVDPNEPYTVYLAVSGNVKPGGGGPYKSVDGGRSWTWIGKGLPENKPYFWIMQWAQGRQLAVGPNGTIVAISKQTNQVHVYDPASQEWKQPGIRVGGLPHCAAADWLTPGRFFVAVRNDGLWRSEDNGQTWVKVVAENVTHVMTDKAVNNRVAAATSDGLLLSTDGGTTWTSLDKKLPDRVEGNMMAFVGERLVVGSNGSGAFWIPLSAEGNATPRARTIEPATIPESERPENKLPELKNLGGESGAATPDGWRLWQAAGRSELVRDTKTFRVGKSSIGIHSDDPAARATVYQDFTATDTPFSLKFWAKATGAQVKKAQLAIQVFNDRNEQVGWIVLGDFANASDGKWVTTSTITLPADAKRCKLLMLFEGAGTANIDDIRLTAEASTVFPKPKP